MSKFLTVAASGLAFLAVHTTGALAVPVTFNPSAAFLGAAPNSFSADTLNLATFATTTMGGPVAGGVSFTETGYLNVSAFVLNGTAISPPGLATGGANSYSLYFQFTATGTQSSGNLGPSTGAPIVGKFDSLSFTLYGANGLANFSQTSTGFALSGLTSTPVALATGVLLTPSENYTTYKNSAGRISATANDVQTSFDPVPGTVPGFFSSPSPFSINLSSAFTNDSTVVSLLDPPNGFRINGGSGSSSFLAAPVPEPMSLALLGTGLLGAGILGRRRK